MLHTGRIEYVHFTEMFYFVSLLHTSKMFFFNKKTLKHKKLN